MLQEERVFPKNLLLVRGNEAVNFTDGTLQHLQLRCELIISSVKSVCNPVILTRFVQGNITPSGSPRETGGWVAGRGGGGGATSDAKPLQIS